MTRVTDSELGWEQSVVTIGLRPQSVGYAWDVFAGDNLIASGWQSEKRAARLEAHDRGVSAAVRWLDAESVRTEGVT